jgi:phosphatidate cytidylyltransferase
VRGLRSRIAADWNARVAGWWIMALLTVATLVWHPVAFLVLIAWTSFQALREFVTLSPTRRGDHHTLFWAFFVILPLHYYLVAMPWYGLWSIFIPVWCFLFVAARSALAQDPTRFLERVAKIQWGLLACVYALGHLPALLWVTPGGRALGVGEGPALVLWLLVVVQGGDVLQYCWGKALGRHRVVPRLSPNKTWEGLVLGLISAAGVGAALAFLTPFPWWKAGLLALGLGLAGFLGGLVMSAIKRDAGVKDWSHLIPGHGGVLDRVDSLVFAAPAFFHLVRFYGF